MATVVTALGKSWMQLHLGEPSVKITIAVIRYVLSA